MVGLGLLAAGCSETSNPASSDAAAYRPAPEVAPIERLGRWDGQTFVPVDAGSVVGGNVYVLVHGWAPGYLADVQRYKGPGPLLAWSPQAVDDDGVSMVTEFEPLAAAITRDVPDATVLAFSWLDGSATAYSPLDAWKSEANTDINGQRLAAGLGQLLAPTFDATGGHLHLIGHSHGAKVATVAAISLPHPPTQLTLLDSPENVLAELPGAANHLEGYLPLLPIGRGPDETFVDSYFSIAGERYGTFPSLDGVVDVELEPAQFSVLSINGLIAKHEYPVDWYGKSAADLAAGVGFAWSPPTGMPLGCQLCFFRQDWTDGDGNVIRADELRLEQIAVTAPKTVGARSTRPFEARPLRGPSTSRHPEGVVLTTPGSRLWQVEFDRDPNDLAIEFDHRFTAPGAGAQLAVWLDDRQVLAAAADWSGATGHHAVVDVSSLDEGPHTFTAVVSPPARGEGEASATLGGFVMVSQPGGPNPGEPLSTEATLALVALGLFLLIGVLAGYLRHHEHRMDPVDADPTP